MTVTDTRKPPDTPQLSARSSRTAAEAVASPGATFDGNALVLSLPISDLYVDWLEGVAPSVVVKGKLADLKIVLSVSAKSKTASSMKTVTVIAAGKTRSSVQPFDFYDVTATVNPPNSDPTKRPQGDMELIDPGDRDPTCEPDAGWRVTDLKLDAPAVANRQLTSGELAAIELDSLVAAKWTVYPENPGCNNQAAATAEQRSRAFVRWKITPGAGATPPLEFSQNGPDSCFVYAREVKDKVTCTLTGTAEIEEYVDPSGHGPLMKKTATIIVTVVPRRLRIRLDDAAHQPLANRSYVFIPSTGRPVKGTTGGDGIIDVPIAPELLTARLEVYSDDDPNDALPACVFDLTIGDLFSVNTHTGVRSRLNNRGLSAGAEEPAWDSVRIGRALQRFQTAEKLTTGNTINKVNVSGQEDDQTRAKLKDLDAR